MKRNTVLLIVFSFLCSAAFSSDVSLLLDNAKSEYEKGNIKETISCLDSARKLLDKELSSVADESYIELKSWDVVKLKPNEFIGKKVKIITRFYRIQPNGLISLADVSFYNTYEDFLIDILPELEKYREYRFLGTVEKDNIYGLRLNIEGIE